MFRKIKNLKMKKYKIIFFYYFLYIASKNLIAHLPCSELPKTADIVNLLAKKPISDEFHSASLRLGCNVNDSIKKRLLYLINWKWSEDEISNFIKEDLAEHKEIYDIENVANKIAKNNKEFYKRAVDSLTKFWEAHIRRRINRNQVDSYEEAEKWVSFYAVYDELLLAVGYLEIKQAIPILEKALLDTIHYNSWIVNVVLSRFGNKNSQKYVINSINYDSSLNGSNWINEYHKQTRYLLYIATQSSIFKLHSWLDTTKTFNPFSEGNRSSHCSSILVYTLKRIILNTDFQTRLKNLPDDFSFYNSDIILYCRDWLLKNKGKYIINKEISF
jgi:hypothetical protein